MRCLRSLLMVPEAQGIYIEPTNICTLKCAGCARTTFLDQWPQQWKNHSIDIDAVMRFLDIDLTDKTVLLSGNYGDPIYHPDFIGLVQQLKQRGARLKITTNGSYKRSEWWHELVALLTVNDTVIFSIDGVPENFTQYRENADWASILLGIQACVAGAVQVAWKYIPFSYNQNNIAQAQQLSQELGFDSFFIDPSKRFDDSATQDLKPDHALVNTEYLSRVTWKQTTMGLVDARCASGQEHFITADGYYSPCCFVADHRFYYKTEFGKNKRRYNIAQTTLTTVLSMLPVVEFYQNIADHAVCQFSCPKQPG